MTLTRLLRCSACSGKSPPSATSFDGPTWGGRGQRPRGAVPRAGPIAFRRSPGRTALPSPAGDPTGDAAPRPPCESSQSPTYWHRLQPPSLGFTGGAGLHRVDKRARGFSVLRVTLTGGGLEISPEGDFGMSHVFSFRFFFPFCPFLPFSLLCPSSVLSPLDVPLGEVPLSTFRSAPGRRTERGGALPLPA